MMQIQINTNTENNSEIVKLTGSLDLQTVPVFKQRVNDLLKKGKSRIILDLEELSFIDSAGLGALLTTLATSKKAGGFIKAFAASKAVARVFEITHMDKAFKIFATLDETLEHLEA